MEFRLLPLNVSSLMVLIDKKNESCINKVFLENDVCFVFLKFNIVIKDDKKTKAWKSMTSLLYLDNLLQYAPHDIHDFGCYYIVSLANKKERRDMTGF